jgi:hypothetical protein
MTTFIRAFDLLSPSVDMLALPYKRFVFAFDGDFKIRNVPIMLSAATNTRGCRDAQDGDTGVAVWDAAVYLTKFLEKTGIAGGKVVLELGCGLGLCGIAASLLGARTTVLTDLEYILPATVKNIAANSRDAQISVQPLDWSKPESSLIDWRSFDLVIASDTVWLEHLVPLFVGTLEYAVEKNSKLTIILSNQRRSEAVWMKFLDSIGHRFLVTKVCSEGVLEIISLSKR